ncbi:unnamed protein product [Acanthoscelides obtectus]|uniref:Uncharacterized protein n=1 Tax=Acanthoscelides obtectus TaxID=200917 RepID=A0A9P0K6N6_ACAOB|nr:unnamed protein product [Acanthoscelides obtectus]CAK1660374.1 hypothetical protein AOBTE_LOCUS22029 [Acanthoscelides obtectus]
MKYFTKINSKCTNTTMTMPRHPSNRRTTLSSLSLLASEQPGLTDLLTDTTLTKSKSPTNLSRRQWRIRGDMYVRVAEGHRENR